MRPCPAVLRCHPSFVKVRCDWSIRVASVFRSFALVCLPVLGTFARSGPRVTSLHVSLTVLCISVFTLFTVTGSSTCHLCSTGISGRKRATVACYTPLRLFRGLCSLLLDCGKCENWWCGWTKATDRAETSEVLEERLHEVEAEVQESRVDSCWNFQVCCDLTCTLTLLALLIITILATGWGCVRTCCRDQHRWRSEERDCLRCPWRQRWYDDLLVGTMARVSYMEEEIDHERVLLRTSCRISEQGGAQFSLVGAVSRWRRVGRRHAWHRSRCRPVWILESRRYRNG